MKQKHRRNREPRGDHGDLVGRDRTAYLRWWARHWRNTKFGAFHSWEKHRQFRQRIGKWTKRDWLTVMFLSGEVDRMVAERKLPPGSHQWLDFAKACDALVQSVKAPF